MPSQTLSPRQLLLLSHQPNDEQRRHSGAMNEPLLGVKQRNCKIGRLTNVVWSISHPRSKIWRHRDRHVLHDFCRDFLGTLLSDREQNGREGHPSSRHRSWPKGTSAVTVLCRNGVCCRRRRTKLKRRSPRTLDGIRSSSAKAKEAA